MSYFNTRFDYTWERYAANREDCRLEALAAQEEMEAEAERWSKTPEGIAYAAKMEAEAKADEEAAKAIREDWERHTRGEEPLNPDFCPF